VNNSVVPVSVAAINLKKADKGYGARFRVMQCGNGFAITATAAGDD
jgi:hypothetical protein